MLKVNQLKSEKNQDLAPKSSHPGLWLLQEPPLHNFYFLFLIFFPVELSTSQRATMCSRDTLTLEDDWQIRWSSSICRLSFAAVKHLPPPALFFLKLFSSFKSGLSKDRCLHLCLGLCGGEKWKHFIPSRGQLSACDSASRDPRRTVSGDGAGCRLL